MSNETKEVEIMQSQQVTAIIPKSIEQITQLAKKMAISHMMPKGMEKEEDIFIAILMGLELGLSPMQAVQNIAVINGRPSIWGDASIGLVQASGKLESIEEYFEGQGDNLKAVCIAKRLGKPNVIKREFSITDAKKAGLWSKIGVWQNYPKRMLQMRARSWTLRDGFADVLKGLSITEEAMDMEQNNYMGYYPEDSSETSGESLSSEEIDAKFNELLPDDIDEQILYAFIHKCVSVTNKKSEEKIDAQDVKVDAIKNMEYFLKAFEKFQQEFKTEQEKEKAKESKQKRSRQASPKKAESESEPQNGDIFSKLKADKKLFPDTYRTESQRLELPLDPDKLTKKNAEALHVAINAKADRQGQNVEY